MGRWRLRRGWGFDMAKEGFPHRSMAEAFEKRLRQLFPEPEHIYSLGKKVANGLKPDVYLLHPDGRQWAYEMVHCNHQPDHLNDNHSRYQGAGIQDIWILWDDLRPRIGAPLSMQQGVFMDLIPSQYAVAESRLTAPQKAILNMQPPGVRYLYAFSVAPAAPELHTELLDMLSIGINCYAFQSLGQPGAFQVKKSFIPMVELNFGADGRLEEPANPALESLVLDDLLRALGYEANQPMIPSTVMQQVIEMMRTPEKHPEIIALYLKGLLHQASPELLEEIQTYRSADASPPVEPYRSAMDLEAIRHNLLAPDALRALADDLQTAQAHIAEQPISPALKQFLLDLLNQPTVRDSAEWLEWQATSPALEKARAVKKKNKK